MNYHDIGTYLYLLEKSADVRSCELALNQSIRGGGKFIARGVAILKY